MSSPKSIFAVMSVIAISCAQFGAFASDSTEADYLSRVESKLLKMYFPPQNPWALADSTIKVRVQADGRVSLLAVTKLPLVNGKTNAQAEQALQLAVKHADPLPSPPQSMHPPVDLAVEFQVKSKTSGGFRCRARPVRVPRKTAS